MDRHNDAMYTIITRTTVIRHTSTLGEVQGDLTQFEQLFVAT